MSVLYLKEMVCLGVFNWISMKSPLTSDFVSDTHSIGWFDNNLSKIVSEYDQEIPQSQTTD